MLSFTMPPAVVEKPEGRVRLYAPLRRLALSGAQICRSRTARPAAGTSQKLRSLVGVSGLEPPTPASRSRDQYTKPLKYTSHTWNLWPFIAIQRRHFRTRRAETITPAG